MDSNYTEPIIKGTRHKIMLPEGSALVLEGGGTRGFFSAGVLDAFREAGVMFPYIAGITRAFACGRMCSGIRACRYHQGYCRTADT